MDFKELNSGNDSNHFWFRARRDFLKRLLEKHLTKRSAKILVVGAGAGDDLFMFSSFGDLTVTDIGTDVVKYLRSIGFKNSVVADARKLQFKDETFDYILALDVVEHIDMDYEVLKEFFRVLKQNGKVFITVPANPWLFSGHDVALEHKRRYTRRSLKKLLLSQNFSICELGFWNFILFPLAVVKRLLSPQKKPKIDSTKISPLLDKILFKILKIEETAFLLGIKAPFGLSLFSVLLKSKKS